MTAWQIGHYFILIRLPLISGFLFIGILTDPFVLDIIPAEALHNQNLHRMLLRDPASPD